MDYLLAPFKYDFFRTASVSSIFIGALCGLLGVCIVLRGMSYLGHGMAHGIFGGAAVAFVMQWNFYVGAGLWGFLSAVLVNQTVRRFKISADAAIGVITTASFALGVAIISRQHRFTQDLEASLFGNILGVTQEQLIGLIIVTIVVCIAVFFLYRQLLFTTFDEETARAYGIRTQWIDTFFSLALAAAIVVSMQVIGVTLIAAAIVIPPITARLLTNRIDRMIVYSMIIGAVTAAAGIYLSFPFDLSSGPAILLVQTSVFVLALVVNSVRGRNQLAAISYRDVL